MTGPLIIIDASRVIDGKLDQVKLAINELVEFVEFVETNETLPIIYQIYLDDTQTLMTVAQVHPDSASMEWEIGTPKCVGSSSVGRSGRCQR